MGTEPRRSRGWRSASPQPGPRGCSRNAQEGPQPLSIHRLRSRLQSSSGKVRLKKKNNKQPSGKPRARVKTFSAGGCPQHPQSDAIPLPQQSALLYYRFSKVSLSNSYSFERSSCSPSSPLCSKFSCVLCWCFLFYFFFFAAGIFIDFSHWAKQHVPHLWGSSFAGPTGLPAIPREAGGRIRGQKNA